MIHGHGPGVKKSDGEFEDGNIGNFRCRRGNPKNFRRKAPKGL
jgi:hypothetical protein